TIPRCVKSAKKPTKNATRTCSNEGVRYRYFDRNPGGQPSLRGTDWGRATRGTGGSRGCHRRDSPWPAQYHSEGGSGQGPHLYRRSLSVLRGNSGWDSRIEFVLF